MTKLHQSLESIGLKKREATVYTTLLKIGSAQAGTIADHAKIKRGSIYEILSQLLERGLVTSFEHGGKSFFQAGPPDTLLIYLETQKHSLASQEEVLKILIPRLQKISTHTQTTTDLIYYEEKSGLLNMLKFFNTKKKENKENIIRGAASTDAIDKLFPGFFSTKPKKPIPAQYIFNSNIDISKLKSLANTDHIVIDETSYPLPSEISTFAEYISIMNFRGKICGINIQNKNMAQTLATFLQMAHTTAQTLSE